MTDPSKSIEEKEKEDKVNLVDAEVSSRGELVSNESEESIDDSETSTHFPKLDCQYEVLDLIGQGGMGSVYRAIDTSSDKTVAIKVLKRELANDSAALKRFRQEAESAQKLDHESLASVYEYRQADDGTAYLVMEYVEGESLSQVLKKEERLQPDFVLNIFLEICEALAYAHGEGVIHRDIKPTNVIVCSGSGSSTRIKLVDFGIAKVMPAANRETHNLTETGDVFGSPHYMSPEQCLGFMLDSRSDIYSLGCLIYEVLTGQTPFTGDNPIQLVMKQVNDEAPLFQGNLLRNKTAKRLQNVVLRCLEKEQDRRYQSVSQIIADLTLIKNGNNPPKYVRRKAVKPKYTTVQTIAIVTGFIIFSIYLIFVAAASGFNLYGDFYRYIPMILAIPGTFVFFQLAIDKMRSVRRAAIPQRTGWFGLIFFNMGVVCASILLFYVVNIVNPLIFDDYPIFLSLIVLANFISMILSFLSLIGSLIFRSDKLIGIGSLAFRLVSLVLIVVLGCGLAFKQPMVTAAGNLAKVFESGMPELSAAMYTFALENSTATDDFYNSRNKSQLALMYAKMGKFKRALEIESQYKTGLNGTSYSSGSETDKELFKKLISLSIEEKKSDKPYEVILKKAKLFQQKYIYDSALKEYNKAIKLKPEDPRAYALRAMYYSKNSYSINMFGGTNHAKYKRAVDDISKAISLAKENLTDYLLIRSCIYRGKTPQSFSSLRTKNETSDEVYKKQVALSDIDLRRALKTVSEKPKEQIHVYKTTIYHLLRDGENSRRELILTGEQVYNSSITAHQIWLSTGVDVPSYRLR